ncbi:MAG: hypothetical protein NTY19_33750 [Planctomycetota bacterium]|nr:hypothetical protein [Planctomycetota bacterium]
MSLPTTITKTAAARLWNLAEIGLIFLLFFLFAGWPAPDVNEAHYLAKAKHYWNPSWCPGDAFLGSADAHLVFDWTFGWLTLLFPLPVVAWLGRCLTWGLLAWSWRRLSFAVVPERLVAVLSAALCLLFNEHCQMAGEWVVGGVEAKGFAYVCVFLALESLLRQRWSAVWIWIGLASAFHVLVGGWSAVAVGCAWLSCRQLRPPLARLAPAMLCGLLLALLGLLPALALTRGVSADLACEANEIYVYGRLSHHLVFWLFPHYRLARQALLLAVWLAACFATPCQVCRGRLGQRPLRGFVGGAVAIALAGIVIDQSLRDYSDLAAALLRYYWFRLNDVMLPVGAALALVALVRSWQNSRPKLAGWATAVAIGAVGTSLIMGNLERRNDLRPGADRQGLPTWDDDARMTRQAYVAWCRVCWWISEHTESEARCITPRSQQTFKWRAGRSEVCSWKDMPQDAGALVDWWQREQEVYPRLVLAGGLAAHGEQRLLELAEKYGARYIVLDRYLSQRPLLLRRVYPDQFDDPQAFYEVYQVPHPASQRRRSS